MSVRSAPHATLWRPTNGPYAESCDYNCFPIADVFQTILASGAPSRIVELGSGTAQHAIYFAQRFAQEISLWQCTDLEEALPGVETNLKDSGASRAILPPAAALSFTDAAERWQHVASLSLGPNESGQPPLFDVVFTANTLHIAPWPACTQALEKLALLLKPRGRFVAYGPFNYRGTYTSASNARFDEWLKVHKSPESAIRHFEHILAVLERRGFCLDADHEMPENNRCLVFRRGA